VLRRSTALQTDRYEITMIDAALHSGAADRRAVFEVFTRGLPPGRRYGVVAGTERVIASIECFQFQPDDISYLKTLGVSTDALKWLASYRFGGDVFGYAEGEVYGAWSPILTVEATFAEAVVLETLILSILNHDAAVAAAASRMVTAAAGARTIEMGSRRTDPDAAVGAARSAAIAGIGATSNLAAGKLYGVATAGTAAHAFTMAHLDEPTAFTAQISAQGVGTTLLVDTYDIANGLRNAVTVARTFGASGPGGVRIDSGDLVTETKSARATLDELGAYETRIVVSGDLDEFRIDELVRAGAPIDVFGVGTSLVVGSGAPTAGLTYKLVSIEDAQGAMHGVAKRSPGKAGAAGRKRAERYLDPDGRHYVERLTVGAELEESELQFCYMSKGERVRIGSVETAQACHVAARRALDLVGGLHLQSGEASIVPEVVGG
jgi:nicotinate phosphoribosyltransferase